MDSRSGRQGSEVSDELVNDLRRRLQEKEAQLVALTKLVNSSSQVGK